MCLVGEAICWESSQYFPRRGGRKVSLPSQLDDEKFYFHWPALSFVAKSVLYHHCSGVETWKTKHPFLAQVRYRIGSSLLSGGVKCPSPGRMQWLHSEEFWWLKPGRALSWCPAKVRKFNTEQLKVPVHTMHTHSSCGCPSNKNYTD